MCEHIVHVLERAYMEREYMEHAYMGATHMGAHCVICIVETRFFYGLWFLLRKRFLATRPVNNGCNRHKIF